MATIKAFRIDREDNIATLLGSASAGDTIEIVGDSGRCFVAASDLSEGHKIGLTPIGEGDPVIKFGTRIGTAFQPIAPGEWVHLHNLRSDYDARSGTLDISTGAPTDTCYE